MEGIRKMLSPDNLSFGLVLVLVFLAPIFFLPTPGMSLDVGKTMLIAGLTLVSLVLWLVGRLIDGVVKVPKSLITAGLFLITLVFLGSALVSPSVKVSLFGQGFETGTFAFILLASLLSLVTSLVVDSRDKIFRVYLALLASFGLIAAFHLIRLFFGPETLSFGIFTDPLSNTVGKWNDLGAFLGLVAIFSLTTLEILPVSQVYRTVLYVSLAAAIFLLAVINFTFAWGILAAVAIILFVYAIYVNKFSAQAEQGPDQAKAPLVALAVLLVSLFFVFTADTAGSYLANKYKVTQIEVRPSWSATYDVAKETLKGSPIFGSGPNRFVNEWSLHKPEVLNSTIFWATDFNAGVGLIPTFAVTTGALGILAWLFFLGTFLYHGGRSILSFNSGRVSQYLTLSSFLGALYLWVFSFVYVPNVVIVSLAFLLTGLFVAVLANEGAVRRFEVSLLGNPKLGFVSVLAIILLIVATATFGYFSAVKTISMVSFQKAVRVFNSQGDVDGSQLAISQAISLNPNDVYYRGLSQIAIARINNLLQNQNIAPDQARTDFTNYMGGAIESARQAINYDSTNYVNWMNIGGIYEAIVPLNVSGAYDEAVKSYKEALNYSPKNPLIYFTLARLEIANKDTQAARDYLAQALTLKNNYTEALFLLSQIEASEGNTSAAIERADQASLLAPNDVGLFFQLGLLKYTARDYAGAILALERATALTPDYANAMYFLGLSYDRVGRKDDALAIFTRIAELNPDNEEIKNILKNLRAGKAALANVPPPAPEKKKAPPIDETVKSQDEL